MRGTRETHSIHFSGTIYGRDTGRWRIILDFISTTKCKFFFRRINSEIELSGSFNNKGEDLLNKFGVSKVNEEYTKIFGT